MEGEGDGFESCDGELLAKKKGLETWSVAVELDCFMMGHESNGIFFVSGSLLLSAVKLTLHRAALDVLSGQAQAPSRLSVCGPALARS